MMHEVSHRIRAAVLVAIAAGLFLAAAPSPPRVYVDEDYDFQVGSPQGWHRANPTSLSVPGEVCRVWAPDELSTISIFLQKPDTPVHPQTLLAESAAAMVRLGAAVKEKEVRSVAGMQAMWLVAEGDGTGAALTGKGSVRTTQHWVAIPRERDILVLLLNTPATDFAAGESTFKAMLGSLRVGGVQKPEQRAAAAVTIPAAAVNLDFEVPAGVHGLPQGWDQPGTLPHSGGEGYEVTADPDVAHGGKSSGRIRLVNERTHSFGTLTQAVAADDWRGKRLRLSGWLRSAGVTSGSGGLWLRVDPDLGFDNMNDRGVRGTTGWSRYEVVLDVPQEATEIAFGALLSGNGTLWVDDLGLEAVGKEVPTTNPRAHATAAPINLDFEGEAGPAGGPSGWSGRSDTGYERAVDHQVAHGGKSSGRLRAKGKGLSEDDFATFTQGLAPEAWRGKRVRLSGWLRSENVNTGWGGLWMRVDGPRSQTLAFDNMYRRGVHGTTEWRAYAVVLDVPDAATGIAFGALLSGDGTLWVDDLTFEVVGKDIPTT
jgi:hypothetical protein